MVWCQGAPCFADFESKKHEKIDAGSLVGQLIPLLYNNNMEKANKHCRKEKMYLKRKMDCRRSGSPDGSLMIDVVVLVLRLHGELYAQFLEYLDVYLREHNRGVSLTA